MSDSLRPIQENALGEIERLVGMRSGRSLVRDNVEKIGKVMLDRTATLTSMETILSEDEALQDLERLVSVIVAIQSDNNKHKSPQYAGSYQSILNFSVSLHLENGDVFKSVLKQRICTLEQTGEDANRDHKLKVLGRLLNAARKLPKTEIQDLIAKRLSALSCEDLPAYNEAGPVSAASGDFDVQQHKLCEPENKAIEEVDSLKGEDLQSRASPAPANQSMEEMSEEISKLRGEKAALVQEVGNSTTSSTNSQSRIVEILEKIDESISHVNEVINAMIFKQDFYRRLPVGMFPEIDPRSGAQSGLFTDNGDENSG